MLSASLNKTFPSFLSFFSANCLFFATYTYIFLSVSLYGWLFSLYILIYLLHVTSGRGFLAINVVLSHPFLIWTVLDVITLGIFWYQSSYNALVTA